MRIQSGWCPKLAAVSCLMLAASGCAGISAGKGIGRAAPEGKTISAEQIRRSGARTGWEALKRTGTHLSMREDARGEPSRLNYRGHNSIQLSSTPLLYVDGAQMASFTYLRDIPARVISRIRIYSGVSGTKYFGTGGGNGVILVETAAELASET